MINSYRNAGLRHMSGQSIGHTFCPPLIERGQNLWTGKQFSRSVNWHHDEMLDWFR